MIRLHILVGHILVGFCGRVSNLSILVQYASVPPEVIDKAADQLVAGVSEAAGLLKEMLEGHPGAIHKIGEELRQEDSDQTRAHGRHNSS